MFPSTIPGALGTHKLMARMWDLIFFSILPEGTVSIFIFGVTWALNLAQALRGA